MDSAWLRKVDHVREERGGGGCIWTEKREEILDRGVQISPQTQLHVLPWHVEGDGLQTGPTLIRPVLEQTSLWRPI